LTGGSSWKCPSFPPLFPLVCCVPFEDQAAITNNLGLGTPLAGNLEVYPVYRVVLPEGLEEAARPGVRTSKLATIVRGVLFLPKTGTVPSGTVPVFGLSLLDISGRRVLDLRPGANNVSRLSPGVYFVRNAEVHVTRKVVVAR